ncbi:hypothetical protein [Bdellovibrio sp. HCB2-146]|uniref:hypothetical protein n=1 Tax=Bdellovibrio sp. HCB2-146 TaxID=3394362 RepID=UPI0039BD7AC9
MATVFKVIGVFAFILILQGCNSNSSLSTGSNNNNSAGSGEQPTPPPPGGVTIPTRCNSALPANAQLVNVSNPTKVIGTGTPASCTFAALKSAVAAGGIITFNCGPSPVTIPVTATMNLPTNVNTVIDGGGLITLDGQSAVQILRYESSNFMVLTTKVTLQNLTFINGKTTPVDKIPTAPAPCSQGYDDGQGGAIFMRDGNLAIINCTFSNNQAALLGPDTGGGAIYILGSKSGLTIANSVFMNNKASNGGAVAGLFAQLEIYNSLFQNNIATGNGANYNDASKCSVVHDGQNQAGSGGNGGAIYQDGGRSTNVILCGDYIVNNKAGAQANAGGVFMTSNDYTGSITVQDSIVTGNTGNSWMNATGPALGSAFGVNAKTSTVINSTLQK